MSSTCLPPTLAIIVPCYNEEEIFPICLRTLIEIITDLISQNKIANESYILFVDDGSIDTTWELIKKASGNKKNLVKGIKLSKNQGHQVALLAGLSSIDTDISISIDADLQDDVICIGEMVEEYMKGNDIVYGVRNDRSSDSAFKRISANSFYKLMSVLGISQIENHGDFRLLSQRATKNLLQFKERNIYIRGMVPLVGFHSSQVFYTRKERMAGKSKYPFRKMLYLAIEGITSLSVTPLRIISILGFIICLFAVFISIYALIQRFEDEVIDGWASIIISIFFLGGVQLISIGVIGEYIGKIYLESKHRPRYFIEEECK
jgi:polyisoprenyl-phosphate glycosyltransferase